MHVLVETDDLPHKAYSAMHICKGFYTVSGSSWLLLLTNYVGYMQLTTSSEKYVCCPCNCHGLYKVGSDCCAGNLSCFTSRVSNTDHVWQYRYFRYFIKSIPVYRY